MKKTLLLLLASLFCGVATMSAQSQVKYGVIHYDSLLVEMPAYAKAKAELADLRAKYENEAEYNDATFKRMFADFLQGQKEFPENILLKRQRDLQEAMEKTQEELNAKEYTVAAAGGMVECVINGKREILSVNIKPEAVDPDDVEMLQDMIKALINEAIAKVDAINSAEMEKVTGGLNLPGVF